MYGYNYLLDTTALEVSLAKLQLTIIQTLQLHFNLPLAMSGDIEVNPGPVKDPCGNCNRPVKSNQRSLLCEDCS